MNPAEGVQAVLEMSIKKGKIPCLGCGKRTRSRGVFIPKKSEEWGGIKSKQRVLAYGICPRCVGKLERNPEFSEELEEAILEDIKDHPEYLLQ